MPAGALTRLADAAALIERGEWLSIAGDETALRALPAGRWIGGTIPYFMGADGGTVARDQLFVTRIDAAAADVRRYDVADLAQITTHAPTHGYSLLILPAFTPIHAHFAQDAPAFDGLFDSPLVGWVAGTHLDELDTRRPLTVDGRSLTFDDSRAIALHVPLADAVEARVDLVNLFTPGDGPRIRFPETGFSARYCTVDGREMRLGDYLLSQHVDTRLPLVADYCGASINVSIKTMDAAHGQVDFYAPVFRGVDYRIATPLGDYVQAFEAAAPAGVDDPAFCCNCILNYLYGELQGRRTGALTGPMTFGEIAYQLLNQTLVYLTLER